MSAWKLCAVVNLMLTVANVLFKRGRLYLGISICFRFSGQLCWRYRRECLHLFPAWVLVCWEGKGNSNDLWKPSEDARPLPVAADIFFSISSLFTAFVMVWCITQHCLPWTHFKRVLGWSGSFLSLPVMDLARSHNLNDTKPLFSL